jgi:hypothetical protein
MFKAEAATTWIARESSPRSDITIPLTINRSAAASLLTVAIIVTSAMHLQD